jgi:hypothetical protein
MLSPLAYDTLRRFHEGHEVGDIASATGQSWLQVRNILNVHADNKRVKALEVINEQKPPSAEDIKAAVVAQRTKPRPEVPPAPAKPAAPLPPAVAKPVEPVTASPVVSVPTASAPKPTAQPAPHIVVDEEDLNGWADLIQVGIGYPPGSSIRDKTQHMSELLVELRREIVRDRRDRKVSEARQKIAELKAELAKWQALVGGS